MVLENQREHASAVDARAEGDASKAPVSPKTVVPIPPGRKKTLAEALPSTKQRHGEALQILAK